MKKCSRCKEEKPLSEYYKKKNTSDGLYYHCKTCQNTYAKTHYKENTEYYRSKARRWEKDRGPGFKYNISEERYQDLFGKFEGMCWICKERKARDVDHDHSCCPKPTSCGKCVRGALCNRCNTAIGLFSDNPKYLQSAIEYLNNVSVYPHATNV